ncbi:hypothetical protein L7F22_052856 [Adiantum nelumboides]|nr:hypothetical protein [Adiantum nelumboides]
MVIAISANGDRIVDQIGSPHNTNSTISSGASEQEWRKSLVEESDPIHKESRRSSSREPPKRSNSEAATALPIRSVNGSGRFVPSSFRQNSGGLHLSEHLSTADSSSPSSASSLNTHPNGGGNFDQNSENLFRSTSATSRSQNRNLSKPWEVENGDSSPLRIGGINTTSVWGGSTHQNGNGSETFAPSSFTSTDEKHSTFGTGVTNWLNQPISTRRSLSSNGMNGGRMGLGIGDQVNSNSIEGRPELGQRSLSINTASAIGHGPMSQTFSPSLLSASPDGTAARHGLERLPEGEEAYSFQAPASASPFFTNTGQRHRSTSSAAALQGVGGNSLDHYSRSASVWGAGPFSAGLAGSPGSFGSFHNQHTATVNSPSFANFIAPDLDRGRTTSGMANSYSGGVPAPMHAGSFSAFGEENAHSSFGGGGTDSRRHSITAAPLTGSRRAIGFEVTRPVAGSRTSSVGRFAGSRMFGGGNLALDEDDLASDFDALRVNLDEVAQQQQRETEQQAYSSSNVQQSRRNTVTNTTSDARHEHPRLLSARAHSFQVGPSSDKAVGTDAVLPDVSSKSSLGPMFSGMLSDHAIASLVTLGPLAPPSSGPGPQDNGASNLQDLGKGVPLQMLPRDTPLYIVEFKQGRTDLYFKQSQSGSVGQIEGGICKGDLVIVEADRGKDLGSVINDSITVDQVQTFLAHQAELAAGGQSDGVHPAAMTLSRLTRSVNPKRLFAKAGPSDTSLLHAKAQDEERALTLCTTKVNQRGLPMSVVAAEMQWDRRKLTFYYTATQRVDFRDLVKELFRLYKTRIWMCHLSHPSNAGGGGGNNESSDI